MHVGKTKGERNIFCKKQTYKEFHNEIENTFILFGSVSWLYDKDGKLAHELTQCTLHAKVTLAMDRRIAACRRD